MRTMAAEGKEMYRVVIVRKKQVKNPDYVRGDIASRYWIYLDETFEEAYGPYNSLGAARGVLTREVLDTYGVPRPWITAGRVEKATVTWEVVV